MFRYFFLLIESTKLALSELRGNKLRTFLSLLGICIGIFCIIAVLTAVDSLNQKVSNTFNRLGSDIVFLEKIPFDKSLNVEWWRYIKRPDQNYDDFLALKKYVTSAAGIVFIVRQSDKQTEFASRSMTADIRAVTYDFDEIEQLDFRSGRYFNQTESQLGKDIVILGGKVAEELFGSLDPIGREVKVDKRKMRVIGVLNVRGEDMIGDGYDNKVIVPFEYIRKYVNLNKTRTPRISAKPSPNASIDRLKEDMRLAIRKGRKLKPKEEDNFALNQLSIFADLLSKLFGSLNIGGWIIGAFSILVGGFGIANIMFVSVKERTKLIGIKKSIGATNFYVLYEFLVEAIVLCLIGGLLGVFLVWLATKVSAHFYTDFIFKLSTQNVTIAVILSVAIGLLAGIIPAYTASRLDPVEAMRQ